MVCILHGYYDVHPKMRFSLSPPASKTTFSSTINSGSKWNRDYSVSKSEYQNGSNNNIYKIRTNSNIDCDKDIMQREEDRNSNKPSGATSDEESTSDYKQWLHAMKLVARLPGGIPPEFRRKLWLSLADKYLKSKNVDWVKEEEKCFCEKWREDDEELGIQIVKDLHRTGSTLCTGPAGDVNQAKLKRILLGYARYNPEVGYCQGFNMLGALILQVMDKEETESMKVMVYLVEGILPPGYFCGSMGGLQADMAVFRELMQTKLPRLARHLQKLQGPIENAYEPPLTNVFTMQWFLTMFCTCLPMTCVLRVWDLVLIEGSDVLLRTALALWSLLEDRVLSTRSADDFYGKMGSFSSELLNGHLIDSNGLIEKVVQLGPIQDIQKLRDKHLYSITPLKHKQGLNFYYDEDEPDMDEDSRLAVATVWGIPWVRRGSQGHTANTIKQAVESKDRIALDISLLKKQYDRLRERQKQAHIILTTACSTARQNTGSNASSAPLPVNQLLSGRPAIVTNKGRRSGPPSGAIPPARKPSLPTVLQEKPLEKQLRRGETLHWRDTSDPKRRRDSLTWKEIRAERAAMISSGSIDGLKSQKLHTKRLGKSDSSSYSEESEEEGNDKGASSSDTSLCDDDNQVKDSGRKHATSRVTTTKSKCLLGRQKAVGSRVNDTVDRQRPKSWAPSNSDIPFVLMTTDSPNNSADESAERLKTTSTYIELSKGEDELEEEDEEENSATESDQNQFVRGNEASWYNTRYSALVGDLAVSTLPQITTVADLKNPLTKLDSKQTSTQPVIALLKASSHPIKTELMDSTNSLGSGDGEGYEGREFDVSDEGVTNEYFERINSTERPTKLDLLYSLNEEDSIRDAYKNAAEGGAKVELTHKSDQKTEKNNKNRCMDILVDYSEKSSAACIAEAKTEISSTLQIGGEYTHNGKTTLSSSAASKRRDPRRLTLTRSSTMEIEKRYQALENRLSMEVSSKYKMPSLDNGSDSNSSANKMASFTDVTHMDKYRYLPSQNQPRDAEYRESGDAEKLMSQKIVDLIQRKSKIPSTADLEQRFANIVLEKVSKVSSMSDTNNSKTSRHSPPSSQGNSKSIAANVEPPQGTSKENDAPANAAAQQKTHSEEATNVDGVGDGETITDNLEECNDSNLAEPIKTEGDDTKSEETSKRKKEPPDNNDKNNSENINDLKVKNNPKEHEKGEGRDYSTDEANDRSPENQEDNVLSSDEVNKSDNSVKHKSPASEPTQQKTHEIATAKQVDEHVATSRTQSVSADNTKAHENKTTRSKKENEGSTQTTQTNKSVSNEDKVNDSQPSTSKLIIPKKSPPSTEELEKRFQAQMSISKTESLDDQTSPKSDTEADEADKAHTKSEGGTEKISDIGEKKSKDESQMNLKATSMAKQVIEAITTSSLRRASEPPSTEDLEKRYEVFKRRMSSRNFEITRSKGKASTNLDGSKNSIDQDIAETQATSEEHDRNVSKSSPPSTDSLEKRFDKLQKESESNKSTNNATKVQPPTESTVATKSSDQNEPEEITGSITDTTQENNRNIDVEDKTNTLKGTGRQESRSALIEELQSKMSGTPDGECVKPSSINPNRKTTSHNTHLLRKSNTDETSETHATNAESKSEKCEQFHSPNRKIVRRFSDLPSRADLENRLQFLEEQLSKTLSKQRRASDSEVASHSRDHVRPPGNLRYVDKLESRVRELEKQLKPTVKETTKSKDLHVGSSRIPLEITTDAIDVTGKELVRYTHFGEVDEPDVQNPINISINIHMTFDKDDNRNTHSKNLPKADEINKRLLLLEQQLKNSQLNIASSLSISSDPIDNLRNTSEQPPVEVTVEPKEAISVPPPDSKAESNRDEILPDSVAETVIDQEVIIQSDQITKEPELLQKDAEQIIDEPSPSTDIPVETPKAARKEEVSKEHHEMQKTATANDLDRRLQILEEHMKNSPNLRNESENYRPITSGECKETSSEVYHSSSTIKQSISTKTILTPADDCQCETKEAHKDEQKAMEITEIIESNNDSKINEKDDMITEKRETVVETDIKAVSSGDSATAESHESVAQPKDILLETLHLNQMMPVEVNKKTLVLLLDNEPKAVKVRRLTRANTEELEGLFQALEKQLIQRGQIKTDEGSTKDIQQEILNEIQLKQAQAMMDLTKEIEQFSQSCKGDMKNSTEKPMPDADFDWGRDPVKHHLKKKTVYLPSTKELEARFRSLERQIKLLEDVEKIDVEQRLTEIERKIKLQYSLSHEKDLARFLDLCEGKGLDDTPPPMENQAMEQKEHHDEFAERNQYGRVKNRQSPARVLNPGPPVERTTEDLEYRFRALDLKKPKHYEGRQESKRQPIHPLEMLLDPSPDERDIPTTGELEHRMRVMEENLRTPSPASRKSHSKSPVKGQANIELQRQESPSPTGRGLPTAEQLEARLDALEKEQRFDFKMQKNYKQFNQKLKDVISPSLSFEEFKATRSSSSESAPKNVHRSPSPRMPGSCGGDTTCPKVIRFHEDEPQRRKPRNDSESMKPIADSHCSAPANVHSSVHEGLGVMGIRLMRETSPLRRKGTHTGVPLRTGENINDQLTSIKNTIKSIDSLCEEKPYRKDKCQQYIDSLFSDSTYFASKKSSLDDLTSRHLSRSTSREYGPSIRISEHIPAFTRSIGSADSIRSSSPLRPTSPLQYHSNRDLRRDISPRRRRDEEREENESRVRRDNLLPNIHTYNHSIISQSSHSLTKFHKVDSQLISNDVDVIDVELHETFRHPTFSSNETSSAFDNTNTSNIATTTSNTLTNVVPTNNTAFQGSMLDRPISPYRQVGFPRSNTPVYTPAKLEIRHTTVTSTFYDRVLTEKQLEKKNSSAAVSRSPLLEQPARPSVQTDKSPPTLPFLDSTAITFTGPDSATGNYRTYQPAIIPTNTPSPVIAKAALSESPLMSIHPQT